MATMQNLADNGNFSTTGFWKLKRILCDNKKQPPMAKMDKNGNLITRPDKLKDLYLETYRQRLAHRPSEYEA